MKPFKLFICAVLLLGTIAGLQQIHASTSQLKQIILPKNCVLTTVFDSNGDEIIGECPIDAPEITDVITTSAGTRLVRGVADESGVSVLRVIFRGITYTAGQAQSPLVQYGDVWTFALDALTPVVVGGDYVFSIQAVTTDGRTLTTTRNVTIPSLASVSPDPGSTPGLSSNAATGFAQVSTRPSNLELTQPLHFEKDIFGTTRIWIDEGAGVPIILYQNFSELTKAAIVVVTLGIIIIIRRSVIAVITFFSNRG